MTDTRMPADALAGRGTDHRRHASAWSDRAYTIAVGGAGLAVLLILGAIIGSLVWGGGPAFATFGLAFLWTTVWDQPTDTFGAGAVIYYTLLTSLVALALAVPVSFGTAYFLTETCPHRLRRPIRTAVELLAAIPSIIYGMWGFFVLVPLLVNYSPELDMETGLYSWFIRVSQGVPILENIFRGPTIGVSVLTAGLVLSIMVVPFITAMLCDILDSVPPILKDSARGLGATSLEVFRHISLGYGWGAIIGALMLGLGRALGETMAVTFVIGNANRIDSSLLLPGSTIASIIANEFPEAQVGTTHLHALMALGLILFIISFLVLASSRMLLRSRIRF